LEVCKLILKSIKMFKIKLQNFKQEHLLVTSSVKSTVMRLMS
jgi:hypothetical protein